MVSKPTAAEKADAADRWIDAEDQCHQAIGGMRTILGEGRGNGSWGSGPLFPFIGREVLDLLDVAQKALWDAHKLVAVQAYDERRAAVEVRRGGEHE